MDLVFVLKWGKVLLDAYPIYQSISVLQKGQYFTGQNKQKYWSQKFKNWINSLSYFDFESPTYRIANFFHFVFRISKAYVLLELSASDDDDSELQNTFYWWNETAKKRLIRI